MTIFSVKPMWFFLKKEKKKLCFALKQNYGSDLFLFKSYIIIERAV